MTASQIDPSYPSVTRPDRTFAWGPFLAATGRDPSGHWWWIQITIGRFSVVLEWTSPKGAP